MAGIACAGNWLVDYVKFIDGWPNKGELVNIQGKSKSSGGGAAFNCAIGIAKADLGIPIYGLGCIGNDPAGDFLREECGKYKINIDHFVVLHDTPTSYTDVMTLQSTGERTFFHSRGANAQFVPEHVPVKKIADHGVKIFHLGYLLLLDSMDGEDGEYGIVAARLLSEVKNAGMETSVDVVSESSDRFRKIVLPVLPHVDHCIINEVEAQKITGLELRKNGRIDRENLIKAAADILKQGVGKNVIIHFPEGSVWMDKKGDILEKPSYRLTNDDIVGSVGAGDAFCSGILMGLHENWSPEESLTAGADMACGCLSAADTTSGIEKLTILQERHASKYVLRDPF